MRLLKGCLQWKGSNQVFTYADEDQYDSLSIKRGEDWHEAGWKKDIIPAKVDDDDVNEFTNFVLWFEYD